MSEAPKALDMFARPELINPLEPAGSLLTLDAHAEMAIRSLLTGKRLELLEQQALVNLDAYGPMELGDDMLAHLFNDLAEADRCVRWP